MKTQTKRITQALIAAGILLGSNFAHADDREEIEKLRALVQELDQKIKVLDQNLGNGWDVVLHAATPCASDRLAEALPEDRPLAVG